MTTIDISASTITAFIMEIGSDRDLRGCLSAGTPQTEGTPDEASGMSAPRLKTATNAIALLDRQLQLIETLTWG